MKYYEIHDSIYRDLEKKGFISWDRESQLQALFEHSINQHLQKRLTHFFSKPKTCNALDLGTGTGTGALFLAQQGFNVTAYDGSAKAIEMAKENARKLELDIAFRVGDLVNVPVDSNAPFDLIVDSSLFHCLVDSVHRQKMYALIKNSLNAKGFFFVHTMIQTKAMENKEAHNVFDGEHFVFKDSVLWAKPRADWNVKTQIIEDQPMFPHRKILTADALEAEFLDNGFNVKESTIVHNAKEPSLYVGWLQKE